MSTGNLKDYRKDGKLVIITTIRDDCGDFLPANSNGMTFFASFLGWGDGSVGTGSSVTRAVRDLLIQTGVTEEYVIEVEDAKV